MRSDLRYSIKKPAIQSTADKKFSKEPRDAAKIKNADETTVGA
jgi:hypothetical protein